MQAAKAEEGLPPKIADYLDATEGEANIELFGHSPQYDLLYAGLQANHQVGSIGRIESFTVVQVIDETNMRADITFTTPRRWKVSGPAGQSYYQLDTITEKNVWITQTTANLVDGKSYRPHADAVYEAIGTKQYPTVAGSVITIMHFKTVDMTPYRETFIKAREDRRPRLEKMAADIKAKQESKEEKKKQVEADTAREKALTRKWTPVRSSPYTATFLGLDPKGDWVNLRGVDAKEFRVRRSALSQADKNWIRDIGLKSIE